MVIKRKMMTSLPAIQPVSKKQSLVFQGLLSYSSYIQNIKDAYGYRFSARKAPIYATGDGVYFTSCK